MNPGETERMIRTPQPYLVASYHQPQNPKLNKQGVLPKKHEEV